ncbi:hypothetical protein MMC30_006405 [Trapelia coarctata]|nr:hypothetical protein [Trapelia coarctata]
MASEQEMKAGSDVVRSLDYTSHLGNPVRGSRDSSANRNPASSFLQDLLREKKAEGRRLSRSDDLESHNGSDFRKTQSSPVGPKFSHSRRASGPGVRSVSIPKEMGVRQMEDYISKITKQNFDLKLELYYRRQRQETLEKQLKKMEVLEAENAEGLRINEELLQELEKRDKAIKEAVTMICGLEEKVERLEMAQALTTPSASSYDPTQSDGTERIASPPSSPPTWALSSNQDPRTPLRRPPSRNVNNGSSNALCELSQNIENHDPFDFASLATPASLLSADEANRTPKSPALSLLSLSGFSMYQAEGSPTGGRLSPKSGRSDAIISIGQVLHPLQNNNRHLDPSANIERTSASESRGGLMAKGQMIRRTVSQRIRQGIKQNIPGFLARPRPERKNGGFPFKA